MLCGEMRKRASELAPGDRLSLRGGGFAEVESVTVVPYNDKVYNFTFAGCEDGEYLIANGFYTGDLYMQNKKTQSERPPLSGEEQAFIEEMRRLSETRR